jgi:hypothetical protein
MFFLLLNNNQGCRSISSSHKNLADRFSLHQARGYAMSASLVTHPLCNLVYHLGWKTLPNNSHTQNKFIFCFHFSSNPERYTCSPSSEMVTRPIPPPSSRPLPTNFLPFLAFLSNILGSKSQFRGSG